ncbi:MAG: UDP-3-O-acyl-N-acetylglucosamine deacetylase [candidate division WOR-3 bacterium]|nr:MAG: UDP-3-O-acyl-N-acetylglucosamine deacetylase [candidate division WOR-3 bacterium]
MNVTISGTCLSGNRSKLVISKNDTFALYVHDDSRAPIRVPLNIQNVLVENHLVSLGTTPRVDVVEHLFSALYGLNLFGVRIDVFGHEVPFFDGSSGPFVDMLRTIHVNSSYSVLNVDREILIREQNSFIRYEPSRREQLFIDMELSHPYIETQKIILTINRENYINEIAPARTFVFTDENDPRLKNLPPYGIGITKKRIYSVTPLRFWNEPVRHKLLDLLGDIYIIRKKLVGNITCKNTSHRLNQKFIKILNSSLK